MSIRVTCPSGHPLKLADSMAGRVGPCPICRKPVHVPASGARLVDAHVVGTGARQAKQSAEQPPADASPLPPAALDVGPAPPSAPPAPSEVEPVRTRAKLADTAPMIPESAEEADELEWAADLAWAEPVASPPLPAASPEKPLPAATTPAASPDTEFPGAKTTIHGAWKILGNAEPPHVASSPADGVGFEVPLKPSANPAAVSPTASKWGAAGKLGAAPQRKTSDRKSSVSLQIERLAQSLRRLKIPGPRASLDAESKVQDMSAAANIRQPSTPREDLQRTIRRIAVGLAVISLIAISPALKHWDLAAAPGWARGVLLWSALQLAYAVWLATVPDWGALWVAMIVFATTATLYGTVGTVALAMPPEFDLPLDLAAVRSTATVWCFTMALLMIGAAYWCGRAAQRAKRTG